MEAVDSLEKITPAATSNVDVKSLRTKCFEAMNDDLNYSDCRLHISLTEPR